jgi:hypothetical protein
MNTFFKGIGDWGLYTISLTAFALLGTLTFNYLTETMAWKGWDGMEWNGMEWNGMEWNGMEWNGMEWNGMEWNGMDWNGMEWKDGMGSHLGAPL